MAIRCASLFIEVFVDVFHGLFFTVVGDVVDEAAEDLRPWLGMALQLQQDEAFGLVVCDLTADHLG